MEKATPENMGIKRLLKKYRDMFRIPENLNHYSETDYRIAEKKFLKYALSTGRSWVHRQFLRQSGPE
jgi:hypothetical protein